MFRDCLIRGLLSERQMLGGTAGRTRFDVEILFSSLNEANKAEQEVTSTRKLLPFPKLEKSRMQTMVSFMFLLVQTVVLAVRTWLHDEIFILYVDTVVYILFITLISSSSAFIANSPAL